MSVVVKGMKMPRGCNKCNWLYWSNLYQAYACRMSGLTIDDADAQKERDDDCPLVALPDKHGRLVDADALRESVLKWLPHDPCGVEENEHPYETDICVSMLMEIEDAPTIVEAEGE